MWLLQEPHAASYQPGRKQCPVRQLSGGLVSPHAVRLPAVMSLREAVALGAAVSTAGTAICRQPRALLQKDFLSLSPLLAVEPLAAVANPAQIACNKV